MFTNSDLHINEEHCYNNYHWLAIGWQNPIVRARLVRDFWYRCLSVVEIYVG